MTKKDKLLLIHFVTRTGMYINPIDINNVHSFITGYTIARKNKCNFINSFKKILSTKYRMKYLSDGWIGQINRVSKKQSISNIVTFKKITLETIFIDGLDKEMEKILKSRILDLINKIDRAGHPWYKETWKDDWLSLILINKNWFKQMWSDEEFEIIKLIDKEVTSGNITNIYKTIVPSDAILNLKEQFDKITFN